MKRIILIVLDSFGIGAAKDAEAFHDAGTSTIASCATSPYFKMPNMQRLGLFNIDGVSVGQKESSPIAGYARMQEASLGKDTTIGHWEIAGIQSMRPLPTYPNGFPKEIIDEFSKRTGRGVLCNRYIDEKIREDIKNIQQRVEKLRAELSERLVFADSEPFHITINAAESGFDGKEFADLLRAENVECEYADSLYTVLLTSPFEAVEKLDNLESALKTTVNRAKRTRYVYKDFSVPKLKKAMSIRNAVFSTSEMLKVENSEGRVCSAVNVPCPPAIPIALSGEVINKECIDVFLRYGIRSVNVVKE